MEDFSSSSSEPIEEEAVEVEPFFSSSSEPMEEEAEETLSPQQSQPDRISELSHTLLHRILSFMDTRTVIETSFLSRRWRYVWNSLPVLNFDNELYRYDPRPGENNLYFEVFVNRVLYHHIYRSTSLHSFSLSCCARHYNNQTNIKTWIQVAVMCNVVEIELIAPQEKVKLDLYLFSISTSLTKLKIVRSDLIVDGSPKILPRLETLHLERCSILGISGNVAKCSFLRRCPVLETLVMFKCSLGEEGLLPICSSQLKTLEIIKLEGCIGCKISAPKLASFKCRTRLSCEYTFVEAASLDKATVMSYDEPHWQHFDSRDKVATRSKKLIGYLNGINSVKSLILSTRFFEVIKVPQCLQNELIQFWDIKFLRLSDVNLSRSHTSAIPYLLEKCPNVETLSLEMAPTWLNQVKLKTGDKSWMLMVQCPELCHLKFLEIRNIVECKTVLELVVFFMKNAKKLEKVNIFTFREVERRSKRSIARKRNMMERFNSTLKKVRLAYSSIEVSILSGMHREPIPKPRPPRAKTSF